MSKGFPLTDEAVGEVRQGHKVLKNTVSATLLVLGHMWVVCLVLAGSETLVETNGSVCDLFIAGCKQLPEGSVVPFFAVEGKFCTSRSFLSASKCAS